jgi:hypothetical protein
MGRIAMGTLLDDFLQIHAITGDIIFFMGLLIAFNIQRETKRLFGATVEEKRRAWWHKVHKKRLAYFTNVCLGRLECCKFSQNSNVASSAKLKNDALNINKSSWFSGLGVSVSPGSHGFNPCCIHIILMD